MKGRLTGTEIRGSSKRQSAAEAEEYTLCFECVARQVS